MPGGLSSLRTARSSGSCPPGEISGSGIPSTLPPFTSPSEPRGGRRRGWRGKPGRWGGRAPLPRRDGGRRSRAGGGGARRSPPPPGGRTAGPVTAPAWSRAVIYSAAERGGESPPPPRRGCPLPEAARPWRGARGGAERGQRALGAARGLRPDPRPPRQLTARGSARRSTRCWFSSGHPLSWSFFSPPSKASLSSENSCKNPHQWVIKNFQISFTKPAPIETEWRYQIRRMTYWQPSVTAAFLISKIIINLQICLGWPCSVD